MMPTDKYGYLQRTSVEETSEDLSCQIGTPFQGGGATSGISFNTVASFFASLEEDRFTLSNEKLGGAYLATDPSEVNHVTEIQSNSDGEFEPPINIYLTRKDGKSFSKNGFTLVMANFITSLEIIAWSNGETVVERSLTDADSIKTDLGYEKKQSFFIDLKDAFAVQITINKIDKPYNFFYCFNLDLGISEEIKGDKLLSVEVKNNFSLYGDSLEYSTLDFKTKKDKLDRTVEKNEKINVLKLSEDTFEPVQGAFFSNEITEEDFYTSVNSEDVISLLDEEIDGGMFTYNSVPSVGDLLEEILGEELLKYFSIKHDLYGQKAKGYFPICTKREAIQQILLGCNARIYKSGGTDLIAPFNDKVNDFVYDESKIVENPQIIRKQPLTEIKVRTHDFERGTERSEIYRGQARQDAKILLDKPFWGLSVYRIIDFDNGKEEPAPPLTPPAKWLEETHSNYFTLGVTSTYDIIVRGNNYIESVVEISRKNPNIKKPSDGLIKTVDLYAYSDAEAVCNLLYELYSRPYAIKFKTLYEPILGEVYNILGHKLNIKSVKETLNGVYEVEAY